MVVLGDGLQDARHPNHQACAEIIRACPQVQFYGYIDLGVHSPQHPMQNLELSQIQQRAEAWKQLGMRGLLLDDYGYDFGVTRQRQIEAVECIHRLQLKVIANSWDPRHALDNEAGPANPKGLATPLGRGDFYLYESYLVSQGEWAGFKAWRAKAATLSRLSRASGVEILSCTTSCAGTPVAEMWPFVVGCAGLEEHRACGWGEPNFSASCNQAPWRERPHLPSGMKGSARGRGSHSIERNCQQGVAVANYLTKEFKIEPKNPWWKKLFAGG
ncbi:hypothetical protein JST97_06720 [bacterium]|nr:hypothetical protein [bacterium]